MKKIVIVLGIIFMIMGCSSEEVPEVEEKVIIRPPEEATLIYPENKSTCLASEASGEGKGLLDMSWEASVNTHSYDLTIINLIDLSESNYSDIPKTTKQVELEKGVPYAWHVISKSDDTTAIAKSETWAFYLADEGTSNYAPFPPELISPSNGILVSASTGKITLTWASGDPDGDEILYTVYVDTTQTLESTPEAFQNLSATEIEVSIEPESLYYWKVKASDGNNASYSQISAFRTD